MQRQWNQLDLPALVSALRKSCQCDSADFTFYDRLLSRDILRLCTLNILTFAPRDSQASVIDNLNVGNKWFKLGANLSGFSSEQHAGVIGFGGAWSNFIHSLAITTSQLEIPSVGVIRGLHHATPLNAMLSDARDAGMRLQFVNANEYRKRRSLDWQRVLQERFPDFLILPEGGSNLQAAKACRRMVDAGNDVDRRMTHWLCAVGTGATVAGLAAGCIPGQRILASSVVADANVPERVLGWIDQLASAGAGRSAKQDMLHWLPADKPGYGKLNADLCRVINEVYRQSGVLLDPIYSVKALKSLLVALQTESSSQLFACTGQTLNVALVHCGGLQGWRGMYQRYQRYLSDDTVLAIRNLPLASAV